MHVIGNDYDCVVDVDIYLLVASKSANDNKKNWLVYIMLLSLLFFNRLITIKKIGKMSSLISHAHIYRYGYIQTPKNDRTMKFCKQQETHWNMEEIES